MEKTQQTEATLEQQETVRASAPGRSLLDRLGIVVSLFALYFIWGSTYLGMRIALEGLPPFIMSGIRFLIAGTVLYGYLRIRREPNPRRGQWLGAALIGLLLVVGGNGGVTFAEQWVASGLAAVAVGAMPLWAALFIGLMGRWPARLEWIGLLLGFTGVILLNLGNGIWATPIGAISLLLAPMCWALGSALATRLSLPKGLMSSAIQMLTGGVVMLIISQLLGEHVSHLPTPRSLLALAYLIIFGSLVAYSAYGYLLRKVRPALATSYAYVNPAVALLLGAFMANEPITLMGVLAMLIILTGVGLVSLGRGRGK
ncbi:MAG: drug/metabolite exporter YedA [Ktedonobacteraceae bacterium]|nr:drug/metabolite exporter YedA [Ktedonobacteraceae bacterium]